MKRSCRHCNSIFEIDAAEIRFLEQIAPTFCGQSYEIPPPQLCPRCRLFRRLSFRNNDFVTTHPSSFDGRTIFSEYFGAQTFPVVSNSEWWGDTWDGLELGQAFDGSRSFFEQWRDLRDVVPMPSVSVLELENSDYCNNASRLKNCYLTFNAGYSESCFYCDSTWYSRDCLDCTRINQCELCYNCVECDRCYNLQDSTHCEDCFDSFLLLNCRGCSNCFGCVNLRKQKYCIFNQQYSKAEYQAFIEQAALDSYAKRESWRTKCYEFALAHPRPHLYGTRVENVTGNFISNARNVRDSFCVSDADNCANCYLVMGGVKSCRDISFFGLNIELCYESVIIGHDSYRILFSYDSWNSCNNLVYCNMCPGSSDCFGCVGLKRKRFCILNKQYTESEYYELVPRLIEHMGRSQEWGEFFPANYTPFPYNTTLASRHFPMTREQALSSGFEWNDREAVSPDGAVEAASLPDKNPETLTSIVVKSAKSDKPFRVTAEELARYKQLKAPMPRINYHERIEERWVRRGGIELYDRVCDKSGQKIRSTFAPTAPEIVWERGLYDESFN